MSAVKELNRIIGEAIHHEDKVEELANLIGNVDHITDEHEPADDLEDAYITHLVYAEIRAEEIVNIIHPQEFADHDTYWNAVINVRLYIQTTDINEMSVKGFSDVITKGFQPCGL